MEFNQRVHFIFWRFSAATAKAAGKPGPGAESGKPLPMTNDKSSMTNSQSRSPKF
jgi:hypothetical protein